MKRAISLLNLVLIIGRAIGLVLLVITVGSRLGIWFWKLGMFLMILSWVLAFVGIFRDTKEKQAISTDN